jgi:hypothetical protein
MPVYSIDNQGNCIITPNNFIGDCNCEVHWCTFLAEHLIKNETADTNATTSTWHPTRAGKFSFFIFREICSVLSI